MENDQLVIKGKHYGIEDMDRLPKSLKPINVTTKSNDTVFGYFGELNPLSNFHPAKFSLEGKTFHCSEQYIQWKKAELFKDVNTMKKVERAKTGHQCKEAGKSISNFKKTVWEQKASELCKPGIRQKFIENKTPRDVLLHKTSGKHIVECTKETPWGCGVTLKDDNCLIPTKWTSQGIMGTMLEEIRQELTSYNIQHTAPIPASNSQGPDSLISASNDATTTTNATQSGHDSTAYPAVNMYHRTDDHDTTASSESSSSDSEMQQ